MVAVQTSKCQKRKTTDVQYLALNGIAEEPLVFKGGTYLWFAHGLDRFSEDLDFTASEPLPSNIAEKVSTNLGLFGVENQIKHITNNETTLSFRISAKGRSTQQK